MDRQPSKPVLYRGPRRIKPYENTTPSPSTLERFPIEIRSKIYGYLLLNPLLGTPDAVDQSPFPRDRTCIIKYDLHTAILFTCRRYYMEASEVLYSQTFIAVCDRVPGFVWGIGIPTFASPLTMGYVDRHTKRPIHCPENLLAMKRVRKWKVLLNVCHFPSYLHDYIGVTDFYLFCLAVSKTSPQSIEIELSNTHRTESATYPRSAIPAHIPLPLDLPVPGPPIEPSILFAPLTMVRNVGRIVFVRQPFGMKTSDGTWEPYGPGYALKKTLKRLAESNRPVENLSDMHELLVKFAQSFETHEPFKLCMGKLGWEIWYGFRPQGYLQFLSRDANPYYDPRKLVQRANKLESMLIQARTCAYKVDSYQWKEYRNAIVRYFQPQYNRLMSLSSVVRRQAKLTADETKYVSYVERNFLLGLINDYAVAFEREKDEATKEVFQRHSEKFEALRKTRWREILLGKLNTTFHSEDFTVSEFNFFVHAVVADMERQLKEIRKTYEHLFDADVYPGERQCDVVYDEYETIAVDRISIWRS